MNPNHFDVCFIIEIRYVNNNIFPFTKYFPQLSSLSAPLVNESLVTIKIESFFLLQFNVYVIPKAYNSARRFIGGSKQSKSSVQQFEIPAFLPLALATKRKEKFNLVIATLDEFRVSSRTKRVVFAVSDLCSVRWWAGNNSRLPRRYENIMLILS